MLWLLLGLLLFLGGHSIRLVADGWRTEMILKLGVLGWKAAYALLALAGFALLVLGYAAARADSPVLWTPPLWAYHLAFLLTLPAFVLLVAAYVPGNRLKARVGHPMLLATKFWALGHLLCNGRVVDLLLFGSFLAWAIVLYVVSRRRDRRLGITYPRLGWGRDVAVWVLGLALWFVFAHHLHAWLIGIDPLVWMRPRG
jgi:uncharacterized membrane protein